MFDWLREFLPDWLVELLPWLGVASLACFLLTPVLVVVLVARMRADHFAREHREPGNGHPVARLAWHLLRNTVGAVLVLAGIAMLVLPGQGLLTILIGLVAMDFPGKYELERRVARRPAVLRALNAIRRKAGRPPLDFGDPAAE